MHEKEKHLTHFVFLAIGLMIFVFLFILFSHETRLQLIVGGLAASFYTFWGIIHHAVEERLTGIIALEYLLIGSFVFLVIATSLSI